MPSSVLPSLFVWEHSLAQPYGNSANTFVPNLRTPSADAVPFQTRNRMTSRRPFLSSSVSHSDFVTRHQQVTMVLALSVQTQVALQRQGGKLYWKGPVGISGTTRKIQSLSLTGSGTTFHGWLCLEAVGTCKRTDKPGWTYMLCSREHEWYGTYPHEKLRRGPCSKNTRHTW